MRRRSLSRVGDQQSGDTLFAPLPPNLGPLVDDAKSSFTPLDTGNSACEDGSNTASANVPLPRGTRTASSRISRAAQSLAHSLVGPSRSTCQRRRSSRNTNQGRVLNAGRGGPTASEESVVAGWRTRAQSVEAVEQETASHAQSLHSGCQPNWEGMDEAQAPAEASSYSAVELLRMQSENDDAVGAAPREGQGEASSEEPESPTLHSMNSLSPLPECPEAPHARSKELVRQSSLKDTKLLLTTKLKRSHSIFMFDRQFEFLREIGRGSYSTVYEARDQRGGSLCAVKMSKRSFTGREDRERYLHEIESVAGLSEHPHVVKYFRGWQQNSHFYIQMELCEGGSLRALLDSANCPLSERQIWVYIRQVASGIEHIHAKGVLHLDIKPDNILLDNQGVLKIGDFGSAVVRKQWDWEEGDGGYIAPELLREHEPSPHADMYSFGAMVFEWTTGHRLPRTGPAREGLVDIPADRSDSLRQLVRKLLSPVATERPSASEVLAWAMDG